MTISRPSAISPMSVVQSALKHQRNHCWSCKDEDQTALTLDAARKCWHLSEMPPHRNPQAQASWNWGWRASGGLPLEADILRPEPLTGHGNETPPQTAGAMLTPQQGKDETDALRPFEALSWAGL